MHLPGLSTLLGHSLRPSLPHALPSSFDGGPQWSKWRQEANKTVELLAGACVPLIFGGFLSGYSPSLMSFGRMSPMYLLTYIAYGRCAAASGPIDAHFDLSCRPLPYLHN